MPRDTELIRIKKTTKKKLDKASRNKKDTYDSLINDIFTDQERRRREVFKHRAERLDKIGRRRK